MDAPFGGLRALSAAANRYSGCSFLGDFPMNQDISARGLTARNAYERIDSLIKSRDLDEAEGALVQAAERHGQDLRYYRRAYRLARLRKNFPAAAAAADRRIALGDASPRLLADLPKLRFQLGDMQGARAAAVNADDFTRDVLDAVIAVEAGDESALREALVRVDVDGGRNRMLKGSLARVLGELPVGGAAAVPEGKNDLAALSGVLPPPQALRRALITEDDSADVIISPPGDGDTIAVIFTGLRDRMQYPLTVLDHYLAALGVTAVYLRDFDRLLYWNGVRSWGGPEAMPKRIRSLAAGRRLVVIGGSAGGFGAIRWGIDLGADRIIAFAPPTNLEEEFRQSIGDGRAKVLANRLRRHIPPEERNLAHRIAAAGGRIPIHLVFGSANAIDSGHARNLAGIPGVHLHSESAATHLVLHTLVEAGGFERVLAGLLGLEPAGDGGSGAL